MSTNHHARCASTATNPPAVLVFAGHDPGGGAGIQADIEALAAAGCHALPVITCLTVQNTQNVLQLKPLEPDWVLAQAEALLADLPIAACKLGLLGSAAVAAAVAGLLRRYPQLPVVFDPVLAAGGGRDLSGAALLQCLREQLLPLTTLLTPNSEEARRLTGLSELQAAAQHLLTLGCQRVLITGTHEADAEVINTLYSPAGILNRSVWPRLPGSYHGSGCTLAAAIAAQLALGQALPTAVAIAESYTWHSLYRGWRPGAGQFLPRRYPG